MEGEHITDFESPASTARSTGESESFEDVRSYGDATHKDATGAPASTKDDAPDHTAALRAAPPTDEVSDSRSDPYTSAAEGRDDDHLVDRDDGDDDDADEYGDGGFPPVPGSGGDEYSNGEYPDDAAAAAADDTHDDGGGPLYDETLPDGRTVRRRRRSHDEADDLPDSDKDADLAASYKEEGNRNFGSGEHEAAAACYKEALRVIPRGEQYNAPRSVFYSNRAACFLQLGRNEEALYDCDRALENCPGYVKALARRATALERLGKLDEALRDCEAWTALEPSSRIAADSAARLKKAMAERDEKLKDEMMGKLKDLGNSLLGKFGMSLDNFKAVKDPNTGSYSISFQR